MSDIWAPVYTKHAGMATKLAVNQIVTSRVTVAIPNFMEFEVPLFSICVFFKIIFSYMFRFLSDKFSSFWGPLYRMYTLYSQHHSPRPPLGHADMHATTGASHQWLPGTRIPMFGSDFCWKTVWIHRHLCIDYWVCWNGIHSYGPVWTCCGWSRPLQLQWLMMGNNTMMRIL